MTFYKATSLFVVSQLFLAVALRPADGGATIKPEFVEGVEGKNIGPFVLSEKCIEQRKALMPEAEVIDLLYGASGVFIGSLRLAPPEGKTLLLGRLRRLQEKLSMNREMAYTVSGMTCGGLIRREALTAEALNSTTRILALDEPFRWVSRATLSGVFTSSVIAESSRGSEAQTGCSVVIAEDGKRKELLALFDTPGMVKIVAFQSATPSLEDRTSIVIAEHFLMAINLLRVLLTEFLEPESLSLSDRQLLEAPGFSREDIKRFCINMFALTSHLKRTAIAVVPDELYEKGRNALYLWYTTNHHFPLHDGKKEEKEFALNVEDYLAGSEHVFSKHKANGGLWEVNFYLMSLLKERQARSDVTQD